MLQRPCVLTTLNGPIFSVLVMLGTEGCTQTSATKMNNTTLAKYCGTRQKRDPTIAPGLICKGESVA